MQADSHVYEHLAELQYYLGDAITALCHATTQTREALEKSDVSTSQRIALKAWNREHERMIARLQGQVALLEETREPREC